MPAIDREDGRVRVSALVERFASGFDEFTANSYNETQARTDFVTPFLEALGWDVHNTSGLPQSLREVFEEATVEVADEPSSKRPDYELRFARERKFFVEAKKPTVSLATHQGSAFQIRRYAFSAGLSVSLLTNFHTLSVYDGSFAPDPGDLAHVARQLHLTYNEYVENFDRLWDLFSKESVLSGAFDEVHTQTEGIRPEQSFDELFLGQVRTWRRVLAEDIFANNGSLSTQELNYATQLYLSRIIFLRICEDRDIEMPKTLEGIQGKTSPDDLSDIMVNACEFYNSGLFNGKEESALNVSLSPEALNSILQELYYPHSPYTFAVVETEVLSQIYEEFLGERMIVDGGKVRSEIQLDVREAGGVYQTPRLIVDEIVNTTIDGWLARSPAEALYDIRCIDICCGSGVFLLSLYEELIDRYTIHYTTNDTSAATNGIVYQINSGTWRLSFAEKRRILLDHIFGVDIDFNAVEVAKLSLLLKLTENETKASLQEYVSKTGNRALPDLSSNIKFGNSLVEVDEWEKAVGELSDAAFDKIAPFSFRSEFPEIFKDGGFDVIVGNPPYTRIQHLQKFASEELGYFQHKGSPYVSLLAGNFDKYGLFVERSLQIANKTGRVGLIIPHKFMTVRAGGALRKLLSSNQVIDRIVHFGTQQVFGKTVSNYTCLLFLDRASDKPLNIEVVTDLDDWFRGQRLPGLVREAKDFGEAPWSIAGEAIHILIKRIRDNSDCTLEDASNIFVGLQTSADEIYIFEPVGEDVATATVRVNGTDWPIEKGILRPCIQDAQLTAYGKVSANRYMIFPYELFEPKDKPAYRLLPPEELAAQYPLAWAYLRSNEEQLSRRSIAGGRKGEQQFYQFGRTQSITKMLAPKIVLPVLSRETRYAYDTDKTMLTGGGNGPYYCIRSETEAENLFLLAILNHPVSEAIIRIKPNVFRGGYYSHGRDYIRHLPIPMANRGEKIIIVDLVRSIQNIIYEIETATLPADKVRLSRKLSRCRLKVERLVFDLFGLNNEDEALVRSVGPPPT